MSGLLVSEIFGPTVQGEGPSLGRRAGFVRLGTCNLDCTWCDTPYTWDWSRFDRKAELRRMELPEVLDAVRALDVELVVITGGEPLVQRPALSLLLAGLSPHHEVEVETNGTISPGTLAAHWNVSPKLAHSGVARAKAWHLDVLAEFVERPAVFKFVVRNPADLDEVAELVGLIHAWPSSVWIMPEGCDTETLARRTAALADAVVARGWNLTTRLHVLAWGDRRGH